MPEGTVQVGGTRVTLDTIVHDHLVGVSPEEMASCYPALDLADIYATITYYLHNREEMDTHLRWRAQQAEDLRRTIEANQSPRPGMKQLLQSPRAARNTPDAASGE